MKELIDKIYEVEQKARQIIETAQKEYNAELNKIELENSSKIKEFKNKLLQKYDMKLKEYESKVKNKYDIVIKNIENKYLEGIKKIDKSELKNTILNELDKNLK